MQLRSRKSVSPCPRVAFAHGAAVWVMIAVPLLLLA